LNEGIRYTSDSVSIFESLAAAAEINNGLNPASNKIFIRWMDVSSNYRYSLTVFIGAFVAFNGALVLFVLTRRIFYYFCCGINPCTFERDIERSGKCLFSLDETSEHKPSEVDNTENNTNNPNPNNNNANNNNTAISNEI
jgi:hypothetical protein